MSSLDGLQIESALRWVSACLFSNHQCWYRILLYRHIESGSQAGVQETTKARSHLNDSWRSRGAGFLIMFVRILKYISLTASTDLGR